MWVIALVVLVVLLSIIGWRLWLFFLPEPEEKELIKAILESIKKGEWEADFYGTNPCMSNIKTRKRIFTSNNAIGGTFAGEYKSGISQRQGRKIVYAFQEYEHSKSKKDVPYQIEEILGHPYEPPLDPVVIKEAKKNLKLWTKR